LHLRRTNAVAAGPKLSPPCRQHFQKSKLTRTP
jgi:hypothetical protein